MKIGSLCSGYGGLDMAVEAFYGAETAWMCDNDKSAAKVIAERWKKPNLWDLKEVNWEDVEPVDILTAGYPCQPFSNAGLRRGANDPRHLWPNIKEIISTLRPGIVILENVRGHLTLGFKEVLQDLTEIGYDARWQIVRASDAGAPHRRERLFVLAQPTDSNGIRYDIRESGTERNQGESQSQPSQRDSITSNANDSGRIRNTEGSSIRHQSSSAGDSNDERISTDRETSQLGRRFETPAHLWMRDTPNPLDQSKLNPKFVEYMMGLPEGWVTDLDLSRAQQFKLLGNGVVPQQAYEALIRLNSN